MLPELPPCVPRPTSPSREVSLRVQGGLYCLDPQVDPTSPACWGKCLGRTDMVRDMPLDMERFMSWASPVITGRRACCGPGLLVGRAPIPTSSAVCLSVCVCSERGRVSVLFLNSDTGPDFPRALLLQGAPVRCVDQRHSIYRIHSDSHMYGMQGIFLRRYTYGGDRSLHWVRQRRPPMSMRGRRVLKPYR